mmetsp:Transcript_379/g.1097  ORF Transcript_379/g.1097 Transcript_379/m.1097 type:complete len:209 (-) Transcript_379:1444-2070(-)
MGLERVGQDVLRQVLGWLTPLELGTLEMCRRSLLTAVAAHAESFAGKKYSDAAAARAVGIRLGTRYLWGRELGVTFPPMRPFKEGSLWSRVPGSLPESLAGYLSDDWFAWQRARFGEGPPAPAKWSEELAEARPEADFYCVVRVVKKQRRVPDQDVVQRLVPLSALGNKTRDRYQSVKVRTPFDIRGDRAHLDFDDVEEEEDVWADDR